MSVKQLQQFNVRKYQNDLLQWYAENKRELPWRETSDPYRIWVSEIMLQQTQVITVIPYYERFLKKFPTVFHLAQANEQTVLKEWEGLGYYSRARYLHEAAKDVVEIYDGVVPSDKKQLSNLKGIGPYTSGAILSIAFNKPEPAVDGNVMRVLSRALLIYDNITEMKTRRKFEDIVRKVISKEDPSSFNQGLMELGALICTPKSPLCLHCPVRESCQAFETGVQTDLPVKTKAKKQRVEPYFVVIIKDENGAILIEQRPDEGLLANMWQFPMISERDFGINEVERYIFETYHLYAHLGRKLGNVKHVFSHKIWELTVYEMSVIAETNNSDFQTITHLKGDSYKKTEQNKKPNCEKNIKISQLVSEENLKDNRKYKEFEREYNQENFNFASNYDKLEATETTKQNVKFAMLDNLSSYPFSVSHLKVKQFLTKT